MRKYRTKSGKVEEKLPGIDATVSKSEKVQIAMAGGADTLKAVRDILGHEGKRNNLKKGQGAKHLVSYEHADDDTVGQQVGPSDSPGGLDPGEGSDGAAGWGPGGQFGGFDSVNASYSGGGRPAGPNIPDLPPDPAKEKPSPTPYDYKVEERGIKAYQQGIKGILFDPDRDMTIPTDEESKKARESNLKQAYSDRLTAYTVNVLGVPLDKKGLIDQTVGELRDVQKAEKDSWISKVSAGPNPKGGIKSVDDYSKLGWMALGLVPPLAAAVGVPAAATTVANVAITAKQLQEGVKAYNAPEGISLKDREGNVIPGKEFPTEKMIEESIYGKPPAPPTTPDYSGDGDDAPKKKKLFRSAANNTTLAVDDGDFTRKDIRRARRQITRFA